MAASEAIVKVAFVTVLFASCLRMEERLRIPTGIVAICPHLILV
jgi:hypothetical protein